ncbi:MAG: hypothetical protein IPJ65_10355 [Archangiaceae bacterium]|nr:hypothetical protein [Archangiaceae bacterium]
MNERRQRLEVLLAACAPNDPRRSWLIELLAATEPHAAAARADEGSRARARAGSEAA